MSGADKIEKTLNIHKLRYSPGKSTRFQLGIDEMKWDGCGVLALVGKNGAGKSTLMSILAGLQPPSEGYCTYTGYNTFHSYDKIKFKMPLVSWDIPLNPQMKPEGYIRLSRALAPKWNKNLEKKLISEFVLPLDQRIGQLSRGEHAKLKLLLAACMQPDILLIDELTNDLDSDSRRKIFAFIDEQVFESRFGIIWATNILSDVEKYATHIVLLIEGQLKAFDSMDEFRAKHQKLSLQSPLTDQELHSIIGKENALFHVNKRQVTTKNFGPELVAKLSEHNIRFVHLPYSLEEIINDYGVSNV